MRRICESLCLCVLFLCGGSAIAGPVGMLLPQTTTKKKVIFPFQGLQKVYVYHHKGIESLVVQPRFRGNLTKFGLLLAFPANPVVRTLPWDTFAHVDAAIVPPSVRVSKIRPQDVKYWKRIRRPLSRLLGQSVGLPRRSSWIHRGSHGVGIYDLYMKRTRSLSRWQKWIKSHGYRISATLRSAAIPYIKAGWVFVLLKVRVENPQLQMMPRGQEVSLAHRLYGELMPIAFRFRTRSLVLPMRFSLVGGVQQRQVLYLLSKAPLRLKQWPTSVVKMQVPGAQIYRNLTGPLPLCLYSRKPFAIHPKQWPYVQALRSPDKHSRLARLLFASDISAARRGRLMLHREKQAQMLYQIGKKLGLRAHEMDKFYRRIFVERQLQRSRKRLKALRRMTMTIIGLKSSRRALVPKDATTSIYEMPKSTAKRTYYSVRTGRKVSLPMYTKISRQRGPGALPKKHPVRSRRQTPVFAGRAVHPSARKFIKVIARLDHPTRGRAAFAALRKAGTVATPALLNEVWQGKNLTRVGWAFALLAEQAPDVQTRSVLSQIFRNPRRSLLVRIWAFATCVQRVKTLTDLKLLLRERYRFREIENALADRTQWILSRSPLVRLQDVIFLSRNIRLFLRRAHTWLATFSVKVLWNRLLQTQDKALASSLSFHLGVRTEKAPKSMIGLLLSSIRFSPRATRLPWSTSYPFLPSLPWQGHEARRFVSALTSWMLWCEKKGKVREMNAIFGLLRKRTLARTAAYRMPRSQRADMRQWVATWGKAIGRQAISRLLREQGLDRDPRFVPILKRLR